jgi:hypothetical protein
MLETLIAALLTFAPHYLDADQAKLHADAAYAAEQATGVGADLLLSIAWVESRYDPYSVSRMECFDGVCKRKTGHWSKSTKPAGAKPTYYCGVTQVGGAITWAQCKAYRDITDAYLTGAIHLDSWMNSPPCRKLEGRARVDCGLRGYNGGWASIKNEAKVYVGMVRNAQKRFHEARIATR